MSQAREEQIPPETWVRVGGGWGEVRGRMEGGGRKVAGEVGSGLFTASLTH